MCLRWMLGFQWHENETDEAYDIRIAVLQKHQCTKFVSAPATLSWLYPAHLHYSTQTPTVTNSFPNSKIPFHQTHFSVPVKQPFTQLQQVRLARRNTQHKQWPVPSWHLAVCTCHVAVHPLYDSHVGPKYLAMLLQHKPVRVHPLLPQDQPMQACSWYPRGSCGLPPLLKRSGAPLLQMPRPLGWSPSEAAPTWVFHCIYRRLCSFSSVSEFKNQDTYKMHQQASG